MAQEPKAQMDISKPVVLVCSKPQLQVIAIVIVSQRPSCLQETGNEVRRQHHVTEGRREDWSFS